MTDWTDDIDDVLNNIRLNCMLLSKAHKKRYFDLKYSLNLLNSLLCFWFNVFIELKFLPFYPS